LRLPLDIQFIFTANPEDYTNRGAIVTPLKDRIDSQILTHYPRSVELSREITAQEAKISPEQSANIILPPLLPILIEQVAFEARQHELVDQKSGVSARLTISAYENLHSMAERRLILNAEKKTMIRIADLYGIIPSITGKLELVYEGELEGISSVAYMLIGKSNRKEFTELYPDPEKIKKTTQTDPYKEITQWFSEGNNIDFVLHETAKSYSGKLKLIPGLAEVVEQYHPAIKGDEKLLHMEFVLHGLSEFSQLSKHKLDDSIAFSDLVGSMFKFTESDEDLDLN
jgi:magnesium chelatase subunit I